MRHSPRGDRPPPVGLSALKDKRTELERARDHYKAPFDRKKGSYDFAVYSADDVKLRLDELFHGKCAYCETPYVSTAPVDVEHYRPKGEVSGDDDHLGYWWLAMAWTNLLPSCIDCNRRRRQTTPVATGSLVVLDDAARAFSASKVILTGKKDCFPIAGTRARDEPDDLAAEQALLLDPCVDRPDQHLVFHVDAEPLIGLVLAKPAAAGAVAGMPVADPDAAAVSAAAAAAGLSERGAVSIQIYGLNRLGLVQERTRLLRRLEFLEVTTLELGATIQDLESLPSQAPLTRAIQRLEQLQDKILEEMKRMAAPEAPYSAMVAAWIEGFKARLA